MDKIASCENLNILSSCLIIEELSRLGINYYNISPGSRSAPLTIAAGRHPASNTNIFYDERGAAFQALGYARASGKPAVLICTSGTAAANYYPAVIEACQDNIPLIVLSADRPSELRNTGANQTIDQVELFGKYTKYFFDLPCPEDMMNGGEILSIIDFAYSKATSAADAGPVHINCMFREPLAPLKHSWDNRFLAGLDNWLRSQKPFSEIPAVQNSCDRSDTDSLLDLINQKSFGIILAGRNENEIDPSAIMELSAKINWPVFPDITSGLRLKYDSINIIQHFDLLLMSEKIRELLKHVPILHFGSQFVSKRLLQFLESHKHEHIQINTSNTIIDPAKSVTKKITCSINELIQAILNSAAAKIPSNQLKVLQNYNLEIEQTIDPLSADPDKAINEITLATLVAKNIAPDSALFLASSMPVRDMDMFAGAEAKNIKVASNRGASGIDGTIASAYGFSCGCQKPLTLLIGDLAFIHDFSSLAMLNESPFPIIIVLINNHGGGIFSFLPISGYADVFLKYFSTPHNITFRKAAELFGYKYSQPLTQDDFTRQYKASFMHKGVSIIEVFSDKEENFKLHENLKNQIKHILS